MTRRSVVVRGIALVAMRLCVACLLPALLLNAMTDSIVFIVIAIAWLSLITAIVCDGVMPS